MTSPIHEDDGKWYFWDETWSDRLGPYNTKEIAEKAMQQYVQEYL